MLAQFQQMQKTPSKRRKEENNKFLFKRFFKFVQKRFGENMDQGFQEFYRECLSQEFSRVETDEFFILVKGEEIRGGVCWVPRKINNQFVDRLLRIKKFRIELGKYMDENLLNQVKHELKKKGMKCLFRFYLIIKEINMEAFHSTISNYVLSKKLKVYWSVGEVRGIIENMQARMKRFEIEKHETGVSKVAV